MPPCSYPKCPSNSKKGPKVKSYRFPKKPQLRNRWIRLMKYKDWAPHSSARICKLHFSPDQFKKIVDLKTGGVKEVLMPKAVPNLYIEEKKLKKGEKPKEPRKIPDYHPKNLPEIPVSKKPVKLTKRKTGYKDVVEHDHIYVYQRKKEKNDTKNGEILEEAQIEVTFTDKPSRFVTPFEEDDDSVSNLLDIPVPSKAPENEPDIENDASDSELVIRVLRDRIDSLENEVKTLKAQLDGVKGNFNRDQLEILRGNKVAQWSKETMKVAEKLRKTCGFQGYNTILEVGLPFPETKSLHGMSYFASQSSPALASPKIVDIYNSSLLFSDMPETGRKSQCDDLLKARPDERPKGAKKKKRIDLEESLPCEAKVDTQQVNANCQAEQERGFEYEEDDDFSFIDFRFKAMDYNDKPVITYKRKK